MVLSALSSALSKERPLTSLHLPHHPCNNGHRCFCAEFAATGRVLARVAQERGCDPEFCNLAGLAATEFFTLNKEMRAIKDFTDPVFDLARAANGVVMELAAPCATDPMINIARAARHLRRQQRWVHNPDYPHRRHLPAREMLAAMSALLINTLLNVLEKQPINAPPNQASFPYLVSLP